MKVFAQYSAASINENGNSNGKSAQCNMFEQLLFRFAPHSATQFICLFRVERTKVYSQCFNRIFLKCETNTRLSRTKNIRFSTNLQNSCVATCHVFCVFCCVPCTYIIIIIAWPKNSRSFEAISVYMPLIGFDIAHGR